VTPIVLDTNAYSNFKRGHTGILAALESAAEIVVPTPVLGELFAGFRLGTREQANMKELDAFLSRPGVVLGPVDHAVARRYGDIVVELRKRGTPIPTNDIWVAAVAIEHDGVLLTNDEHFELVPMLRLYG
jgi:predicted nucleic acid-binding protein